MPPPPPSLPKMSNILVFYECRREITVKTRKYPYEYKKSRSVSLNHRGQLFKCHCLGVSFIFSNLNKSSCSLVCTLRTRKYLIHISIYIAKRARRVHSLAYEFRIAFVELFLSERTSERERESNAVCVGVKNETFCIKSLGRMRMLTFLPSHIWVCERDW